MEISGKLVTFSVLSSEAVAVLFDLRWMIVLIIVLVISDFWFGVSDSIKQKKEFRFSRAGRRTCNKLVDYVTYLLLGSIFGLAIFEPLGIANHTVTAAVGLGLACIWEIDSIVGHVCSLHDSESPFSVKRLLIFFIKKKNRDLGESIEETLNTDKNKEHEKD